MNLDPAVEIYFPDATVSQSFLTTVELISWVEAQTNSWSEFAELVRAVAQSIPKSNQLIDANCNQWRSFLLQLKSVDSDDTSSRAPIDHIVSTIQQSLSQRNAVASTMELAERAIAVSTYDQKCAVWIFLMSVGFAGNLVFGQNERGRAADFFSALAALHSDRTDTAVLGKRATKLSEIENVSARAESAIQRLDELISQYQNELKTLIDANGLSASSLETEHRSAFDDQIEQYQTQWKKLKSTYDSELKLRAPREYWNSKLSDHASAAARWRLAFFMAGSASATVILAGVYLLSVGRIGIPATLSSFGWIIPAAVLGLPSFLGLWVLRLCGRQWSDHLVRREDSRERIVMIETFLALSRSDDSPGAISDPAQIGLILHSIFRPGPGLVTDDSPPAGFFEAVLSKMGTPDRR